MCRLLMLIALEAIGSLPNMLTNVTNLHDPSKEQVNVYLEKACENLLPARSVKTLHLWFWQYCGKRDRWLLVVGKNVMTFCQKQKKW